LNCEWFFSIASWEKIKPGDDDTRMQLKENQSKNDKDEQPNGGSVSSDEHWQGPRYYQAGHDVLASYVHGWTICVAKVIEIKKIIKVNMKSVLIKYCLPDPGRTETIRRGQMAEFGMV
jgi:hypothetical protein